MPKYLTDDQIHRHHDHGYVAPIDIFTKEDAVSLLARLERADTDEACRTKLESDIAAAIVAAPAGRSVVKSGCFYRSPSVKSPQCEKPSAVWRVSSLAIHHSCL